MMWPACTRRASSAPSPISTVMPLARSRSWPLPATSGLGSSSADAIIKAGIARVVSALEDPNPEVAGKGHERLRAKGITVDIGLRADEARRVHAGHIMRVQNGRPYVMLKLAVSADGKAGLAGRKLVAITGETSRVRVFQMRAASDAIMVGIGTVLSDT